MDEKVTRNKSTTNEQLYVVFTIEQGTFSYLELNLLTAEEAKKAAMKILTRSRIDDPQNNMKEFERRKVAIEKLHCTDLNDEVDLVIVKVRGSKQ